MEGSIGQAFEGYFLRILSKVPGRIQQLKLPHPPIAVAGSRPESKTLEIAGARGWIPMSINFLPTHGVKGQWESVERGAREAGTEPPDRASWRIARDVFVADTTKEARRLALEGSIGQAFEGYFLRILSKVPGRIQQLKLDPEMPDSDVTPEYLMDNVWIVGDPDEVEQKIRRLHEDVGGFGVLVTIGHEWKPKEADVAPPEAAQEGGRKEQPGATRTRFSPRRSSHGCRISADSVGEPGPLGSRVPAVAPAARRGVEA